MTIQQHANLQLHQEQLQQLQVAARMGINLMHHPGGGGLSRAGSQPDLFRQVRTTTGDEQASHEVSQHLVSGEATNSSIDLRHREIAGTAASSTTVDYHLQEDVLVDEFLLPDNCEKSKSAGVKSLNSEQRTISTATGQDTMTSYPSCSLLESSPSMLSTTAGTTRTTANTSNTLFSAYLKSCSYAACSASSGTLMLNKNPKNDGGDYRSTSTALLFPDGQNAASPCAVSGVLGMSFDHQHPVLLLEEDTAVSGYTSCAGASSTPSCSDARSGTSDMDVHQTSTSQVRGSCPPRGRGKAQMMKPRRSRATGPVGSMQVCEDEEEGDAVERLSEKQLAVSSNVANQKGRKNDGTMTASEDRNFNSQEKCTSDEAGEPQLDYLRGSNAPADELPEVGDDDIAPGLHDTHGGAAADATSKSTNSTSSPTKTLTLTPATRLPIPSPNSVVSTSAPTTSSSPCSNLSAKSMFNTRSGWDTLLTMNSSSSSASTSTTCNNHSAGGSSFQNGTSSKPNYTSSQFIIHNNAAQYMGGDSTSKSRSTTSTSAGAATCTNLDGRFNLVAHPESTSCAAVTNSTSASATSTTRSTTASAASSSNGHGAPSADIDGSKSRTLTTQHDSSSTKPGSAAGRAQPGRIHLGRETEGALLFCATRDHGAAMPQLLQPGTVLSLASAGNEIAQQERRAVTAAQTSSTGRAVKCEQTQHDRSDGLVPFFEDEGKFRDENNRAEDVDSCVVPTKTPEMVRISSGFFESAALITPPCKKRRRPAAIKTRTAGGTSEDKNYPSAPGAVEHADHAVFGSSTPPHDGGGNSVSAAGPRILNSSRPCSSPEPEQDFDTCRFPSSTPMLTRLTDSSRTSSLISSSDGRNSHRPCDHAQVLGIHVDDEADHEEDDLADVDPRTAPRLPLMPNEAHRNPNLEITSDLPPGFSILGPASQPLLRGFVPPIAEEADLEEELTSPVLLQCRSLTGSARVIMDEEQVVKGAVMIPPSGTSSSCSASGVELEDTADAEVGRAESERASRASDHTDIASGTSSGVRTNYEEDAPTSSSSTTCPAPFLHSEGKTPIGTRTSSSGSSSRGSLMQLVSGQSLPSHPDLQVFTPLKEITSSTTTTFLSDFGGSKPEDHGAALMPDESPAGAKDILFNGAESRENVIVPLLVEVAPSSSAATTTGTNSCVVQVAAGRDADPAVAAPAQALTGTPSKMNATPSGQDLLSSANLSSAPIKTTSCSLTRLCSTTTAADELMDGGNASGTSKKTSTGSGLQDESAASCTTTPAAACSSASTTAAVNNCSTTTCDVYVEKKVTNKMKQASRSTEDGGGDDDDELELDELQVETTEDRRRSKQRAMEVFASLDFNQENCLHYTQLVAGVINDKAVLENDEIMWEVWRELTCCKRDEKEQVELNIHGINEQKDEQDDREGAGAAVGLEDRSTSAVNIHDEHDDAQVRDHVDPDPEHEVVKMDIFKKHTTRTMSPAAAPLAPQQISTSTQITQPPYKSCTTTKQRHSQRDLIQAEDFIHFLGECFRKELEEEWKRETGSVEAQLSYDEFKKLLIYGQHNDGGGGSSTCGPSNAAGSSSCSSASCYTAYCAGSGAGGAATTTAAAAAAHLAQHQYPTNPALPTSAGGCYTTRNFYNTGASASRVSQSIFQPTTTDAQGPPGSPSCSFGNSAAAPTSTNLKTQEEEQHQFLHLYPSAQRVSVCSGLLPNYPASSTPKLQSAAGSSLMSSSGHDVEDDQQFYKNVSSTLSTASSSSGREERERWLAKKEPNMNSAGAESSVGSSLFHDEINLKRVVNADFRSRNKNCSGWRTTTARASVEIEAEGEDPSLRKNNDARRSATTAAHAPPTTVFCGAPQELHSCKARSSPAASCSGVDVHGTSTTTTAIVRSNNVGETSNRSGGSWSTSSRVRRHFMQQKTGAFQHLPGAPDEESRLMSQPNLLLHHSSTRDQVEDRRVLEQAQRGQDASSSRSDHKRRSAAAISFYPPAVTPRGNYYAANAGGATNYPNPPRPRVRSRSNFRDRAVSTDTMFHEALYTPKIPKHNPAFF
ncbi:unnamed protein product [Amoebophrya sp. A120]|nr:unnamed protein product [Amoebophrya sp. A120]|eukprot:GSA120T00020950001.1